MTFFEARAISQTNLLHIRRSSWTADKWFMPWRGTWFVFATGLSAPIPVRALDYSADDLNATDWTTVPAPLTSCPITPTEPTGGGPPTPGYPGFPDGGTPSGFPPAPGGGGGGGSPPGGGPPLPPANLGTSITVLFSGVSQSSSGPHPNLDDWVNGGLPNGRFTAYSMNPGSWDSGPIPRGHYDDSHDFPGAPSIFDIKFELSVTRNSDGTFTVNLGTNMIAAEAVFTTDIPQLRNTPITNGQTTGYYSGGFAKVL